MSETANSTVQRYVRRGYKAESQPANSTVAASTTNVHNHKGSRPSQPERRRPCSDKPSSSAHNRYDRSGMPPPTSTPSAAAAAAAAAAMTADSAIVSTVGCRQDRKLKSTKHRTRRAEFAFGEDQEQRDKEEDKGESNHTKESEQHHRRQQHHQRQVVGRALYHDGHHVYHHDTIRHLHDPYPQPHQLHLHQHQQQQRRRSTGNSSLHKRAYYENRDSEHGSSSESIPNNNISSRDVDQGQIAILTTDSTRLTQSMQDLSIDKRAAVVVSTAADKMRHSSETHGTVRKVPVSEQRQKQGHEAMRRTRKLVVTETLPVTTALTTATSSSTLQASDAASISSLPGILPSLQHHQLSKRLSRLLHPTPSVASTPSITRITSQPVLTAINVSHSNFKTDDHAEQRPSSPAAERVSKILTPYTTGLRALSRSHSNMQSFTMDSGSVLSSIPLLSPPRTNDGSSGSQCFLISRFLPTSPSKLAHKTSTCAAVGSTVTPLPPPYIKRHRVSATLRMTSTLLDSETEHRRQGRGYGYETLVEIPATPATPSSITSSYSSAGDSSFSGTSSAWNTPESISRTQQKLLLQRASSQDNMDEDEITHRAKTHREMERIQRDYKCTRMFADPILESLARCQARQDVWVLQYQEDQDQDSYYQLPRRFEEDSLDSDCIL